MSDGAVVGIVLGALLAVGLVIALVLVLVGGGDDESETANRSDSFDFDDPGTDPFDLDDGLPEPGSGPLDTPSSDPSTVLGPTALEDVFFPIEGYEFIELSASDLEVAKQEFLSTDPFLASAVEEITVREFARDGTGVGAAFAISLNEALAAVPNADASFLAGAKEGLGGGVEDVSLAGQPSFSGESEGLPFAVSVKEGIFLFVVGEDRVTCEAVMTGMLGNVP